MADTPAVAIKFAPFDGECVAAPDQERLNILAVCVLHQQAAGFKTYVDTREMNCAECGASGFNTGFGYWMFSCGLEVMTSGEACEPCAKSAAEEHDNG